MARMKYIPILIVEFAAAPQITWAVFLAKSHGSLFCGSQKPRCSMSEMLNQASNGAGVAMVGQLVAVTDWMAPDGVFENDTAVADDVASTPASTSAPSRGDPIPNPAPSIPHNSPPAHWTLTDCKGNIQ